MRCRVALEADGIGPWVPFDHPEAMPKDTKGVKIDGEYIEHRLYFALHSAMWTEKRWATFTALVDQVVEPDKVGTRTWISDKTALVHSQIALRATHKGFPRSTGAIEGTIRRIKHVVSERAEYYRNGARLDKLVNLVRLDAIGLADRDIYASLITQHLIARSGAGLDWQSGRDKFGTASIDVRIEEALNEHAPVVIERAIAKRKIRVDARTVEVNAWLAERGLPPIGRARQAEVTDPIYQIPRAGRTIADYPELLLQYDPARNGGMPPERITAASSKPRVWVCTAHRTASGGHEHVWKAPPERRTSGSRCRVCSGHEVCALSSLAYRRPDLADEWFQPRNGTVTPDDVSPGMPLVVFWKCLINKRHKPFPQRIAHRNSLHQGCPTCADDERKERARKSRNERSTTLRGRARSQSRATLPPVLERAARKVPLVVDGATLTPHQAAAAIGRSEATIRNWIRDGRIRAHPPAAAREPFRIPESEVRRVQAILAVAEDPDLEVA